ncbi:MAG: hypothetical protein WBE37_01760 [Bryobacteraceae bacterium]
MLARRRQGLGMGVSLDRPALQAGFRKNVLKFMLAYEQAAMANRKFVPALAEAKVAPAICVRGTNFPCLGFGKSNPLQKSLVFSITVDSGNLVLDDTHWYAAKSDRFAPSSFVGKLGSGLCWCHVSLLLFKS